MSNDANYDIDYEVDINETRQRPIIHQVEEPSVEEPTMTPPAPSVQPGASFVRNTDESAARITQKSRGTTRLSANSATDATGSEENVRPGVVFEKGHDSRSQRKMGRGTASMTATLIDSTQEPREPGVLVPVRRSFSTRMSSISSMPADLLQGVQSNDEEPILPGATSQGRQDPREVKSKMMQPSSAKSLSPGNASSNLSNFTPVEEPDAAFSRPGATAVSGSDARVSRKLSPMSSGRGMVVTPAASGPSLKNAPTYSEEPDTIVMPGTVTSVKGPDSRISRKMSRGMSTTSPTAAAVPSASGSLKTAPTSLEEPEMLMPGTVTSVQGTDSRISRKMGRGLTASSSTAGAAPTAIGSLKTAPTTQEEPEMIMPGTVTSVKGADSRISRKMGRGIITSSSPAADTTLSMNDAPTPPEEPEMIKPGTMTSVQGADSRSSRKIGRSTVTPAGLSIKDTVTYSEEPEAASLPGTMTVMSGADSRISRKVSANRGRATISSGSLPGETENADLEEPDSAPLPGTAVASSHRDSQVSRKIAQAQGVGASAETDDSKVSNKTGRSTRGALLGIAAATAASSLKVGALQATGDDPAASKNKHFVNNELFQTDTGKEIDAEEYLRQQVLATQESQREKAFTKKGGKGKKDGIEDVPKAPGAFSVKGGRGWLTGGFRQRAPMLMMRRGKSGIIVDSDIEALGQEQVREDDADCWDRVDKPTLCVGVCVVIFLIIAISVPVALSKDAVPSPTLSPTSSRYFLREDFAKSLSPYSDPLTFDNPQSAQSQALDWLLFNDEMKLSPTDDAVIQRYLCMVIYFENGGEKWLIPSTGKPWGSGIHECEWDLIACSYPEQKVTALNLASAGLVGTLATEMLHLSQLTVLDLASNKLSEVEFPPIILQMTGLTQLFLEETEMRGTIPNGIGALSKLEQLILNSNAFFGEIPTSMNGLSSLTTFQVAMNRFEGNVLDLVSGWPNLKSLDIGNNKFSGTIPTYIGALQNLARLALESNDFTGTLPTELGMLRNMKSFSAPQNFRLSGSIPTELGNCGNMMFLYLDANKFQGPIPTELGNLRFIEDISLSQNELTGAIPSELGFCSNLKKLEISSNRVSLQVPTELGQLSMLSEMVINFNDVTGSMPGEICALRTSGMLETLAADCFANGQIQCTCCTLCN